MARRDEPDRGHQPPQVRALAQRPADPWVRAASRRPAPPRAPWWRGIVEHGVIAGPILGFLSALFSYHLSTTSPTAPDLATHAVIREVASWHGRFMHTYYITPTQNLLWWAMAGPALAWLVLLVLTVIGLGMRSHYRK